MTQTVTISLDPETKKICDDMAHALGLPRSGFLRMLIRQQIKREKRGEE